MKFAISLCILSLVGFSLAQTRGCVLGICPRNCEPGTHVYSTGCSQKMPEATCDNPNPVKEQGILCDYSACYCDAPTVRDTVSGKCVPLDQCPGRKPEEEENEEEEHEEEEHEEEENGGC